ncbi:MAG: hypothetical protein IKV66_15870 [Clostridia bacterium]|nr:hypothetical protein [Clostridia bacterium]
MKQHIKAQLKLQQRRTGCALSEKRHDEKADQKICKKRLYKQEKLCYPIKETNSRSRLQIAQKISARANRRNILSNQDFQIRLRNIPQKELAANVYGSRKVGFVSVFSALFLRDYMRGDLLGEVVHDERRKDFLKNGLRLFCVEMEQSYGDRYSAGASKPHL